MNIAPPTLREIPPLVELAQLCHLESRFSRLPYDAERVAQRFKHMIDQPLSTTFFVSARHSSGQLHGLMIGSVDEYFFCRERVASSIFLLVHPQHRGGLAAIKMVMAFRAWAHTRAAAEVYIGVASGVQMQRTGRFLSKVGLQLSGGNYSAWLPAPSAQAGVAAVHQNQNQKEQHANSDAPH